jgi:hypothetical protein
MITKFPHYVRLPMRICVGTVVLLGLGNSPSSAQTQTEGLTDNQISTLNTCVDNIYNQMISNSVSTCESPSLYLAAGATDFNSQTYTLRPPTNPGNVLTVREREQMATQFSVCSIPAVVEPLARVETSGLAAGPRCNTFRK